MIVYPKKMLENLNITKGLIFSQELMLELTKTGLSREKSYKMVQTYAKKCFAENLDLLNVIQSDKYIMNNISQKKLKSIFSYSKHFKNVNLIFRRVFK
jgi:adenylosuccinate lyase